MKDASLTAAAAIVVLASAFALLHAARNRSGNPDAQITLTDRELPYYRDPDDSGVALGFRWLDPDFSLLSRDENRIPWLNREILVSLGFDCSVAPSDHKAVTFYARQQPRRGFVALEYEGPAWRAWLDLSQRYMEKQRALADANVERAYDTERKLSTRLMAIDAAGDPAALRARNPDRSKVIIVPAVFRISASRATRPQGRPGRPALLTGMIQQVPTSIHVSRPLSERFQKLAQTSRDAKQDEPLYRVQLTFGSSLEPWVTGAEFSGR